MAIIKNSDIVLSSDIGSVLNAAGGSVNINQPATFFKAEAKINMWSKRKPVPRPTYFCQDFDSSKPDYMAEWWRGKDYNCGISIPKFNSMDEVGEAMDGGTNGWTYDLPNGSSSEPWRLGDFAGYDTSAPPPFTDFTFPTVLTKESTEATASFASNAITNEGSVLSLANFEKLRDCYLGVKLYNTSSGRAMYNTMETTIANSGYPTIKLNVLGIQQSNNWVAFPFISTAPQRQGEPLSAGHYYSIPCVKKVNVSVIGSGVTINVIAWYNYVNGVKTSISVNSITVTSHLSSETLTNNWIKIRLTSSAENDPMMAGEYRNDLPNVTTKPGEAVKIDIPLKEQLYTIESDQSYYIYVTLGTAKYSRRFDILQEVDPIL